MGEISTIDVYDSLYHKKKKTNNHTIVCYFTYKK